MISIKLEILRGGPPHNQLLSPLTQYLGLCGDHPAETLGVPFEHAEVLERVRALGYTSDDAEGDRRRSAELVELGRAMGRILEQAPGLIKDLADAARRDGDIVHLRLVLSANELAILPFELAVSPTGFPGAGEHLCLQASAPVCVTREVRRVAPPKFAWPTRPKILFVAASPPGVGPIPVEAHLLALRQAVDPWVFHFPEEREDKREESVGRHLELLLGASARSIADACASGEYTHVHILAHGVPMAKGDSRRFGLALHDHVDPHKLDVVDGARLGAALRTHTREGERDLACPALVTLATCDSANVGSVIAPGASIAHDLHRAGIPLVVASQYPLSVEGSVHLTRLLYRPLLWGQDPRLVLDDVRRQLNALVHRRHDWASLVVYAALPADLHLQLKEVTFEQARRAIEAAMSMLDALLDQMAERPKAFHAELSQRDLQGPLGKIEDARKVLSHLRANASERAADIDGLLASAEKRLAEFWTRMANAELPPLNVGTNLPGAIPTNLARNEYGQRAEYCLRSAQRHYDSALASFGEYGWALVQSLAIETARTGDLNRDNWRLAWLLSKRESERFTGDRKAFALSSLVELCVLAAIDPSQDMLGVSDPERMAHERLRELLIVETNQARTVHSLRRQLTRYIEIFPVSERAKLLAEELLEHIKNGKHPALSNQRSSAGAA